jgi:hypothetical protein
MTRNLTSICDTGGDPLFTSAVLRLHEKTSTCQQLQLRYAHIFVGARKPERVQQVQELIAPVYRPFLLSAFVRLYFGPVQIENPAKIPTRIANPLE